MTPPPDPEPAQEPEPPSAAEALTVSAAAEMAYCPRSAWYEVVCGRRKARNVHVEEGFLEDQARLDRKRRPGERVIRHLGVHLEDSELGLRGQVDVVLQRLADSAPRQDDGDEGAEDESEADDAPGLTDSTDSGASSREAPAAAEEEPAETAEASALERRDGSEAGVSGGLETEAWIPLEYRHGHSPGTATDVAAMTLLGMMLEKARGVPVTEARLFFMADRSERVIELDAAARRSALGYLAAARAMLAGDDPPANPHEAKCQGCSWFEVCAPDLVAGANEPEEARRILARRRFDRALYVEEPGAKVRVKGGALELSKDGETLAKVGIETVDQVVLKGKHTHITTPAIRKLAASGVELVLLGWNGRLEGRVVSEGFRNPALRRAQHRRTQDPGFRLLTSRAIVAAKIRNQRVSLQRVSRRAANVSLAPQLAIMEQAARRAESRDRIESLLGDEGSAARAYFEGVGAVFASRGIAFTGRRRRPPPDPVNALLSFAYAMLAKDVEAGIAVAGLDPCLGVFHTEHYGRPALALDLMEELRPVVADAVVFRLFNKGMIKDKHVEAAVGGVQLNAAGRKVFYRAWEKRMTTELEHPLFGTPTSLRRTIELQARLFAKVLEGDITRYVPLSWR